jgi:solute carrier family 25 uncoupling protein 8/9
MTTGALGICVASPTDLVKVRLQAEGRLPAGAARRYPSAVAAYGIIAKQEGIAALWTGLTPNVARSAVINAAELASYDQVKEVLTGSFGMEDGVPLHLISGLGAGFVAVCVGSPVDVVKSRIMGDSAGRPRVRTASGRFTRGSCRTSGGWGAGTSSCFSRWSRRKRRCAKTG